MKKRKGRGRESACVSEMVSDVAESLVWWTAIQRDRKINFLPHYQCPAAITWESSLTRKKTKSAVGPFFEMLSNGFSVVFLTIEMINLLIETMKHY